jgi:hypothetical protein
MKIFNNKKIKSLIFLFLAVPAIAGPEEKSLAKNLFDLYVQEKLELEEQTWQKIFNHARNTSSAKKGRE